MALSTILNFSPGVEMRKKTALKRREYSVAGPNALWHIDGNHKLIRLVYIESKVV